MSNFWGEIFYVLGGKKKIEKKFEKYFSNRIEKLHKMAFLFFFLLKMFEKVEKTVFLGLNFSYTVLYPLYLV